MAAIVFVAFAAHVVAWVALPDHKIVKTKKAKVAPVLSGVPATA